MGDTKDTHTEEVWERQTDEPNKWYARFHAFLLLGPSRSLYAVYAAGREVRHTRGAGGREMRGGVPKSWRQAATRWDWFKRAEAWDASQRAEQVGMWLARREELREMEWKYANELLNKARQMLVFPLSKTVHTTQEDGKTLVTEYHPARWSFGDAGRLLETASKLARLAMGEETERVGVNARLVEVTADDLSRAAREAEQWEQGIYENKNPTAPTPSFQDT